MIAPAPCAFIAGNTAREHRKRPRRLTAITRSHSSTGISMNGRRLSGPYRAALFTRMSTRPNRASVSVARRSVSSSRETSHATPSACAPRASTSWTVAFGSATSATTTRAPSAAMPRQYARPMPLAPPVTMTTLSLSRISVLPAAPLGSIPRARTS